MKKPSEGQSGIALEIVVRSEPSDNLFGEETLEMTRQAIPVFLLVGTLLLFQFHADASSPLACSVANAQQAAQELAPGESPGQIRAVLCDDFSAIRS